MTSNGALAACGDISDLGNPILVEIVLHGVFAFTLDVPELDVAVGTG